MATLLDRDADFAIGPMMTGLSVEELSARNINARPSRKVYDHHEAEFQRLSDVFVEKFHDRKIGGEILEQLPEVQYVPRIFGFYIGVNAILSAVVKDFEGPKDYGHGLEFVLPNAESIMLRYLHDGLIPAHEEIKRFYDIIFPDLSADGRKAIFSSYDWLKANLSQQSEWLIREGLLLFQRHRGFGGDACIVPSEKFDGGIANALINIFKNYYELYLKEDFGDAYREGSERRRRFSPKDGRAHYKQVKLQLHEDLVPVLTEALDGANRNAWIEEAIVEKLQREGVEIEMVEQPPLPGRS